MHEKELGEILIDLGVISAEQLARAVAYQRRMPSARLGQALAVLGVVDESTLGRVLCRHFKLPYVDMSRANLARDVIALVPASVVRDFRIIPVGLRDDVLVVATDDPFVTSSAAEIGAIVGRSVAFALATSSALIRLREEHY